MQISKQLIPYFEKAGTTITYHAQDIIYMQQDDAKQLYIITKGRVRVFIVNTMGDEVTLEVINRGRIFGESSFVQNANRPTTAQAVTDVELISCQLDALYPYFKESQELPIMLLQLMSHTCDHLSSMLKKAYTYDRFEKVAAFLVEQTTHQNVITYTHEDIATTIGLSRVTITKVLNEFAKKGYIENKYRRIIVKDRDELSKLLYKE